MIKVCVMNGWKDAPHCWRNFYKMAFARYGRGWAVSAFGFVLFVMR